MRLMHNLFRLTLSMCMLAASFRTINRVVRKVYNITIKKPIQYNDTENKEHLTFLIKWLLQ